MNDPVIITALVTAVGTQLVAVVKAVRCQKVTADAIGSPNGLGTVHQALQTINAKLDHMDSRLVVLESSPHSPKGDE